MQRCLIADASIACKPLQRNAMARKRFVQQSFECQARPPVTTAVQTAACWPRASGPVFGSAQKLRRGGLKWNVLCQHSDENRRQYQ